MYYNNSDRDRQYWSEEKGSHGAVARRAAKKRKPRLAGHPDAPPRRIVQLQYLGWPDMNVPKNARGMLGLVWEVGRIVGEVTEAGAMEEEAKDHYAVTTDGGSDSEVDERDTN
ncbi:hypothetical protein B0H11DRAFT_2211263 [Mycena galericulata]|nr:hypothetical protein B0H11DRAFT_2211263 [Mycena galericulata]